MWLAEMRSKYDHKSLLAALARHSHFTDLYAWAKRWLLRSQVVILMYHRVCPRAEDWSVRGISPQVFERQLEYLSRNYDIISLDEVVEHIRKRTTFPRKALAITIDDGYRDNYTFAYPILRKYRAPATIFLATAHIGTGKPFWWDQVGYCLHHTTSGRLDLGELGRYVVEPSSDKRQIAQKIIREVERLSDTAKETMMAKLASVSGVEVPEELGKNLTLSWEQIEEMSRSGIDFGGHSVAHPILTMVPLKRATWEIAQSKEHIERRIAKSVKFFAYPAGRFNAKIVRVVEASGYVGAVTVRPSWSTLQTNVFKLGRINAVVEDFNKFQVLLSGFWGDLENAFMKREE